MTTKVDDPPKVINVPYDFVKHMTNNFEKEIGRGGFASVHLGKWNDQQVAVKRLKMAKETNRPSSWVKKQFHSEMASLLRYATTDLQTISFIQSV